MGKHALIYFTVSPEGYLPKFLYKKIQHIRCYAAQEDSVTSLFGFRIGAEAGIAVELLYEADRSSLTLTKPTPPLPASSFAPSPIERMVKHNVSPR